MQEDRYGLPLSTDSSQARDAYVEAVDMVLSGTGDPRPAFERAFSADPDFALAYSAHARFLQIEGDAKAARAAGERGAELAAGTTEREQSHAHIFNLLTSGRGPDALIHIREHVETWARDGFALAPACGVFGLVGFSGRQGREPEQVELLEPLVQAYGDDWWFLTQYAFALVELGQWQRGRELVEQALEANPTSAHTAHVLAHALYEGGQDRACADMLERWLPAYGDGGQLACHAWWHLCLVKLMLGEQDEIWPIYDAHCAPGVSKSPAINVVTDGTSLLWRSELAGMARSRQRWEAIAAFRKQMFPRPMVFVDSHGGLPPLALGDDEAFDEWLAQLEESAGKGKLPAGDVPAALARAFAAYERGDFTGAIDTLEPIMPEVVRIGGSRAQRDMVQNTLLSAYVRDGRAERARALVAAQTDRGPTVPVVGYA